MFEFHGWAVVRYDTHDTDEADQRHALDAVLSLARGHGQRSLITSFRHNGCEGLAWNGQHNRRRDGWPVELLKQIAELAPGSYGVLYVIDDEAVAAEDRNAFRVWVLRRGSVSEQADQLLSPFVPRCEDRYDPSRED